MTDRTRIYRWSSLSLYGSLAVFVVATLVALAAWALGPYRTVIEASAWVLLCSIPAIGVSMAVGTWNDVAARNGR